MPPDVPGCSNRVSRRGRPHRCPGAAGPRPGSVRYAGVSWTGHSMTESFSLGRIAGIRVGLNWSLLVVIALIAWTLATGSFPSTAPGLAPATYWVAGVVAAIIFLASLLA